MKKLIALFLALVLGLSLIACGGPDAQPAIDAYNKMAKNYNAFVEKENENLESWAAEDIEYMNQVAAVIEEYAGKLSGDADFTQEQIDEMVKQFNEFNAVIEEYLKG